jgi:RNA polymerase sigma-70 factor (ECF subfamily)
MTGGSIFANPPAVRTGIPLPRVSGRVINEAGSRLKFNGVDQNNAGAAYSSDEEAALMRRVGNGDASACKALVDRHLRSIVSFAYRFLGDFAEAKDIAQETFLRLWRHASQWENRARLSTWLHRVAHNLCIDYMRRRRPEGVEDIDLHPYPTENQMDVVQRDGAARIVVAALAALPERQRSTVILTHYQDLSNIESAEIMNISVDALESLLSRARRGLRERLIPLRDDLLGES